MTPPDEERIRQAREKANLIVKQWDCRWLNYITEEQYKSLTESITTALSSAFQAGRVAGWNEAIEAAAKKFDESRAAFKSFKLGAQPAWVFDSRDIRSLAVPKVGGEA